MATETMILRPVLVDSPDTTLVSLVPSATDLTLAYALINEQVADDDSGYIICSAGGKINSYFDYKRPATMSNITGIAVKIRCKLESSQTTKKLLNSITASSTFAATDLSEITANYVDYQLTFSDIDILINELNTAREMRISLASSIASGTKNSPIRITQIWIEITYESMLTEVYQKIGGIWNKLPDPKFYKFSNGAWQSLMKDEFYDGQKYILQSY